ncbi:2-oxoacid dehydrogenases acyltransferase family protein, partial [Chlamydia psittaci 84-8471/1]
IPV